MSKVFITHSRAVFGQRLDPNYHKVQHRIASRASSIRAELRRERTAIEDARLVAKMDSAEIPRIKKSVFSRG